MHSMHPIQKTQKVSLRSSFAFLLLLPTFLITALIVKIAPHFVVHPDPAKIVELFIPEAAASCVPKPGEVAAYIASVFFPPVLYYLFCKFGLATLSVNLGRRRANVPLLAAAILVQIGVAFFIVQSWNAQLGIAGVFTLAEVNFARSFTAIVFLVFLWMCFKERVHFKIPKLFSWSAARENLISYSLVSVLVVTYSLATIYTEGNFSHAYPLITAHYAHWVAEFESVLIGKTPLVNLFPQYCNLLGLLLLPVFKIFGIGPFSFTLAMTGLSALGLMLVFATLRKLTGRSLIAMLLFVAFIGIAEYEPSYGSFQYMALWPIRCFGPSVAFYFLSRYLDRPGTRSAFVLFIVAVSVALNNLEFGLPALVGVTAAYFATAGESVVPSWSELRRMVPPFVGAVFSVVFGYIGLCFLRTGEIPNFKYLVFYQKIFGLYGLMSLPTPHRGLQWVFYLTYVGAVLFAIYLIEFKEPPFADHEPKVARQTRLNAGLLLFTGIYGAGSLMYYVNRSHPLVLEGLFCVWGLCFAVIVSVLYSSFYSLLGSALKWLCAVPLLILSFTYALCLTPLVRIPNPVKEMGRFKIHDDFPTVRRQAMTEYLLAHTTPHENIAMMIHTANGVLEATQLVDVVPFPHPGAMMLKSQVRQSMDAINQFKVRKVFGAAQYLGNFHDLFRESGFKLKEVVSLKNAYAPLEYWERE